MKIKILFNTRKEWAKKLVPQVAGFLKSAGFEVVKKGADTTICIGGDGTILYYNNIGKTEGAVLGIGSSSSHICILRNDNWRYQLIDSLKTINRIPFMHICVSKRKNKNKKEFRYYLRDK